MNKLLVILLMSVAFTAGCGQSDNKNGDNVNDQSKQSAAEESGKLIVDPKPQSESKVVARVNGVPIYEDELNGRPVQHMVTEEILYQKGLGLGIDEKYAQKLRDYKKHLIVSDIKSNVLEEMPAAKEVSDEEIQSYYENNPRKYTFFRMQEVAFADKGLGDEIQSRVKGGEDLTEIVNSYTQSGANVVGKDLGYNKELLSQFGTFEVGSVTGVISKPDGTYSVVKIVEIKPIPLDQSERAIRHLLEAKRKAYTQDDYASQIAEESGIKIEILDSNN